MCGLSIDVWDIGPSVSEVIGLPGHNMLLTLQPCLQGHRSGVLLVGIHLWLVGHTRSRDCGTCWGRFTDHTMALINCRARRVKAGGL